MILGTYFSFKNKDIFDKMIQKSKSAWENKIFLSGKRKVFYLNRKNTWTFYKKNPNLKFIPLHLPCNTLQYLIYKCIALEINLLILGQL